MIKDQTGRFWPGVPGWGDANLRRNGALPASNARSIKPVLGEKPPLHAEYQSRVSKYKFYEATYNGGSDYKDANDASNQPVFVTHPNEAPEASNFRKRLSMCRNYAFPICKKFGSFIFSQTIIRDIRNEAFSEWCKDVDGNGTSIEDFMEDVSDDARYLGVYAIVFDTTKANLLETEAESTAKQNRPILSCLHPSRIVNWTDDKQQLLIKYDVGPHGQLWLWTQTTIQKFNLDDQGKVKSAEAEFEHGYSRMPIILVSGRDEWESLITDIAEAQQRIYVLDSLLIEEQVKQTFTNWAMVGVDSEQIGDKTSVAIGGRKFICINKQPSDVRIERLSGETSQAADLRASIEATEKYIYTSIGLKTPDLMTKEAESGRALRIREAETVAITERIAANIETAENRMIDFYNEALGTNVGPTQYPDEFNSDDIQVLLQNTLQVVSNNFGPQLKATQTKRYISQAFPEILPQERASLEDEADEHFEEMDEQAKAGPVQPENPDQGNDPAGPEPKTDKSDEQPSKGVLGITKE